MILKDVLRAPALRWLDLQLFANVLRAAVFLILIESLAKLFFFLTARAQITIDQRVQYWVYIGPFALLLVLLAATLGARVLGTLFLLLLGSRSREPSTVRPSDRGQPRSSRVTKPIDPKELYNQAFEAHRHASDFRARIIGGWAAMYTAFAAIFSWLQANNHKALTSVVLFAAAVMTLMMWLADMRNRPAIRRAKTIGARIEQDKASDIPEDRRFFSKLEIGIPHSAIIDVFAVTSLVVLLVAALIL